MRVIPLLHSEITLVAGEFRNHHFVRIGEAAFYIFDKLHFEFV